MSIESAFSGLSPGQAWASLDRLDWTTESARHLLRRIGFSATPEAVAKALRDGLHGTLEQYLGHVELMPEPGAIADFRQQAIDHRRRSRETTDPDQRRAMQAQFRRVQQSAYATYGVEWLTFAGNPAHSAAEKWIAFLQNILVVSYNTIRSASDLFTYQQVLREHALGSYPDCIKAASRTAAMMRYLDLLQNTASRPNENFARELFELFILGEGNYGERDIKEAARAFTGYRRSLRGFALNPATHDAGIKTVFGESGTWTGDDVIDLAFKQPAATIYLPTQMLRNYLTEATIPEPYLNELGRRWANAGFDLAWLIQTVFSSKLFYHRSFRGALIKSPNHFLLGLAQDLHLDIRPFNSTLNPLRVMGQPFFAPPNVRGWVGGKQWMNSGTIAARRQLVQQCFAPINERLLNADDQRALDTARESGHAAFHVDNQRLSLLAEVPPVDIARHLVTFFLPMMPTAEFNRKLEDFLAREDIPHSDRLRTAAISLLQSPYYHLC